MAADPIPANGHAEPDRSNAVGEPGNDSAAEPEQPTENTFQITVKLPHAPFKTETIISTQDQAQDVRQSIVDAPHTFQYSCFHLEVNGERVPEFVDLAQVSGIEPDAELSLVEDPYTEKDARMHFLRIRELIGAAGDRSDSFHGIDAGATLHDGIAKAAASAASNNKTHPMTGFDLNAQGSLDTLLNSQTPPQPKTIKSLSLSPWNPPPYHLRSCGHLLYLQVVTLDGEQYQITSHVSGFYVNKCTTTKFDPSPRTAPKPYSAHSLLTLISALSTSFAPAFKSLQDFSSGRDPLSAFQLSNAIPAAPWAIDRASTALTAHVADITRTQECYLMNGADNSETLRDWNEEFQTTRELPRETVQDRVFRERVTSKLFADYNEAATHGAVLVARGEVAPLNPTEPRDAQIFVYNNVFYSFGADGVGTFAHEGGDEAARVATGKDVLGVKMVNQLDIPDLATPGTVIVDYLGQRIVAQSIVPGIFKQREPGEQQIDYGGVEGKEIVAENEAFKPVFEKLSKALRVKSHPVWDKENIRHDLAASVETKGLLGTDGRKYALDLYRITPLDVFWVENFWTALSDGNGEAEGARYPHRMTVFRSELVESYWRSKLRSYVKDELTKKGATPEATQKAIGNGANGDAEKSISEASAEEQKPNEAENVDISAFEFAFNPDVFTGQQPQTEEEKAELSKDEEAVRGLSKYLLDEVLPSLIHDLEESDIAFPMDGVSLSNLLHKRGINIRYLGRMADLASEKDEPRLVALHALAAQEMISRAFKHVAHRFLRSLPATVTSACIAHLLNCLLGEAGRPEPQVDRELKLLYSVKSFDFESLTAESLQQMIADEVSLRFRHQLQPGWASKIKPAQMLREVSLKLGLQLAVRPYGIAGFSQPENNALAEVNGNQQPQTNGSSGSKKKKKGAVENQTEASHSAIASQTFRPEDVLNVVPVIKEASPRSVLADEALEAGRISIAQNQRELGQELLLESLSLHEQIYGILHPEVARVYYQLSSLFYSLDDKPIAVELARKAVIVSERTVGLDSHETILAYLNLGLFEHATGNSLQALLYVRHALSLWKVVFGPSHPDSITTINNTAVMLQHLKLYHDSRTWFEASLDICQRVSGPTSVNTATLLFQLAQALALDQDSKAAVARMREAYNIFHSQLGAEDRNTKEAETWLDQLTQNAVSIAKHAKDAQARRMRRVQHLTPRVTLGTRPQPPAGDAELPLVTPSERSRLDERSIDELLKYIEGGEGAKQTTTKKRPANPKRRQQKA